MERYRSPKEMVGGVITVAGGVTWDSVVDGRGVDVAVTPPPAVPVSVHPEQRIATTTRSAQEMRYRFIWG